MARSGARTLQRLEALATSGRDVETFWRAATEEIAVGVAFDWRPCWFTLDPESLVVTSHFNEEVDELDPEVFRNEYVDDDVNKMAELGAAGTVVATLARATGGDPSRSSRYRDLLGVYGIEHELVAMLRADGVCWGTLTLYRERGADDFSDDDLAFVEKAAPMLAEGARRGLLVGEAHDSPAGDASPAVVVVNAELSAESMTPAGNRWLADLGGSASRVPAAIRAIAAAALESGDPAPSSRVRTRSGAWAALHASLLAPGRAAVIVEPASGGKLGSLLMAAYGLTPREQDVAAAVLRGDSTGEIAEALHLSPYTVQDHLKSMFGKTGARTRRQLLAKVFFDHFEPRVRDNEARVRDGRYMRGGAMSQVER